jgi:hypothetical protein
MYFGNSLLPKYYKNMVIETSIMLQGKMYYYYRIELLLRVIRYILRPEA